MKMQNNNLRMLVLIALMAASSVIEAQRLVVISVTGSPQKIENSERKPLKAWDELSPNTTINIPYDASLDIIDETENKQYHLKTPGRSTVKEFLSNQKNGVKSITQRYLQYIANQMKGAVKRSARRHSDAATVTREVQKYDEPADEWDTEAWEREFNDFTNDAINEYEEFRAAVNQEYAEFMEECWQTFGVKPPIPQPKELEVEPMVIPNYELKATIKSRPIKIENVIPSVVPTPQPLPIEPIVQEEEVVVAEPLPQPLPMPIPRFVNKELTIEQPVLKDIDRKNMTKLDVNISKPVGRELTFYGTKVYVRFDDECKFSLSSLSERSISEAWKVLSDEKYNNTIADCLTIREKLKLSDWAYLLLLTKVGEVLMGEGSSEATLLTAFIYCQSGYKMRLGMSPTRVILLYASRHIIYNESYFDIDGEYFYPMNLGDEDQLSICTLPFPEEQSLSLLLTQEQALAMFDTPLRTLQSKGLNPVTVNVCVNKNLIDFYGKYPSSEVGGNVMSRWAMYANTPLASSVREQLYPELKTQLEGLSQLDAVNRLLSFVQHALTYEYDEKVWGRDRVFFAEESLYYPYADCEDRSILFSRLVRDLVGLKVVLVYYPGHLATAVGFTTQVQGDYLDVDGQRFTVCDPTYIGAPVGRTMPKMDNLAAKAIVLN